MTSSKAELRALLADIDAGPEGPEVGAFFGFDGTLIAGYSAEAFVFDAIRRRKVDPRTLVRSVLAGLDMQLRGRDVTALMEIAAEAGRGGREEALVELGQRLFRERVAGTVYPEARAVVKATSARVTPWRWRRRRRCCRPGRWLPTSASSTCCAR